MWLFRIRKLVKTAGREALILYFAIRDPDTPLAMKALAVAALGYLFSPLDLLPDLPLLGWVDDLVVVSVALPMLIRRLPPEVLARASAQADRVLALLGVFASGDAGEGAEPAGDDERPRARAGRRATAAGAAPSVRGSRRRQPVSDARIVSETADTGPAPRARRRRSKASQDEV